MMKAKHDPFWRGSRWAGTAKQKYRQKLVPDDKATIDDPASAAETRTHQPV
jgi:hypothetical protein